VSRVAGVAVIMALLAVAACSGGSTGAARSNALGAASFVARYYDGAAHLTWTEQHGSLAASMDLTHPGAVPANGMVHQHLALAARVSSGTVTLTLGSDTPWTGNLDGKDLVLSWAPDGGSVITTTFTAGTTSDYERAAGAASRDYAAQQQAIAARGNAIAAAEGQAAANRLAAHDAQVAAMRAAHDAKVTAMRSAHDAAVAAMEQRQAAARAKAAAHHHP
jgi:hypothetical protein